MICTAFDCCASFSRPYLKPIIEVWLLSAQNVKIALNDFIYDGHFDARKSSNSVRSFSPLIFDGPTQPLHFIIR